MEISPVALVIIGLILAAWTAGAAVMMLRASGKTRTADAARISARRMSRMLQEAPAVPLLVRTDGRIEAPARLAGWLGLGSLPEYLSELVDTGEGGLTEPQIEQLTGLVRRTQRTAAPFRLTLTPPGTRKSLALRGALADPSVSPSGAALIWIFDFTESEDELIRLREEAERARTDFGALVGLIEAAPMPMWFRGPDAKLRLVNGAYVEAVGAQSADQVVEEQIELVERLGGQSAADIARKSADRGAPIERTVAATIAEERRTLRVTDLPLMREGIAGYAIDIEEMEEQGRQFRAFREAQRSMLDQLSIGVAQFDEDRKLIFANQPFYRVFSLPTTAVSDRIEYGQFLLYARENGRIPEVRDFPQWRRDMGEWFNSSVTIEENWPLSDNTHLRIIGQPLPDGGLVFIAEDRTEQLALSATRDTMLRTRTATFDSLYEALAVFAPDGHLEIWNRSFAGAWGIDPDVLDGHPNAEDLLEAIRPNLSDRDEVATIGNIIRTATLDRKKSSGRVHLADGRTLEYAGVPLPDGNGLLTVLDITASQQAEIALRERARALEEADAVTSRFLANMSYEFRVPLTSIGGFAELLESGAAGELTDQGKDYARSIGEAVERLSEQVENVLGLSQSEAGHLPLSKEPIDLLDFVAGVVRARENAIESARIRVDIRGKVKGDVMADKRLLGRAIGNLVDNAIAATPGGRIFVELGGDDENASLVISDNGSGMEQQDLARAMDGLRQDGDGGLERRQGLGIPLARQLIESHDGTFQITSRRGVGTTVAIELPRS